MDLQLTTDESGELSLPISGCSVAYLVVDYAITLIVKHPIGKFELRIACPFHFKNRLADSILDPERQPEMLGPTLGLARTGIETATAYRDGRLELAFGDESRLTVHASEEFEAWELAGPGGLRVICTPGGELAVWDYKPRAQ